MSMIDRGMGVPSGLPGTDVRGKVVLLTGDILDDGTTQLAREFVKRGCRVVLAGVPRSRLAEVCYGVAHTGNIVEPRSAEENNTIQDSDSVIAVELDTTRGEHAVEQAVDAAWLTFGGIDVLIHCTSPSGTMKPVLEAREKDYDEILTMSVKASWLVSTAVARKMRKADAGGSIVFLTSISGTERGIYPGVSLYATSMAAINHLTKMMALELGKYGIRVNAVACGLNESSTLLESKGSLGKLAKRIVPMQRWSEFPIDITGVLLWLASDSSTFVTGTISIVDGALSIRRPRFGEYRSRL